MDQQIIEACEEQNLSGSDPHSPLTWSSLTPLLRITGFFLLTVQVLFLVYCSFSLSRNFTHTSSFDIDAAHHLNLAKKGTLGGDIGWYVYGPFFYKSAHFLAHLIPNPFFYTPKSLAAFESSLGTGFRLTTLLFALLFVLTFSKLVFKKGVETYLFAASVLTLLLSNPVWTKYMFRVYPDALLSFLLGLTLLCALFSQSLEKRRTKELLSPPMFMSVLFWACAFHVKIIAVFFGPGLYLLLMSKRIFSTFNLALIGLFIGLTYLIGYPSTTSIFEFWQKTASEGLRFKGEFNDAWLSFFLNNYYEQAFLPCFFVAIVAFLVPVSRFPYTLKTFVGILVSALLPFFWLMLSPLDAPAKHYAMNLALAHTLLIFPAIACIRKYALSLLREDATPLPLLNGLSNELLRGVILFGALLYLCNGNLINQTPLGLAFQYDECAKEISAFERRLKHFKGYVMRTPYTPRYHGKKYGASFSPPWWQVSIDKIEPQSNALLISRDFISRFITSDARYKLYIDKLYDANTLKSGAHFAPVLMKSRHFKDMQGASWKRLARYEACDFDFWIRK